MTALGLAVILKFAFKPDAVHKYLCVSTYKSLDGKDKTTFEREVVFKNLKLGTDGRMPVSKSSKLLRLLVGNEVVSKGESETPNFSTEKREETGRVLGRELDPYFPILAARQLRPTDIWFETREIDTGASWQASYAKDESTSLPRATWKWTLTRFDSESAWVAVEFHEEECDDPISATGTIQIDRTDGWIQSLQIEMSPTVVPGDSECTLSTLSITWKRT